MRGAPIAIRCECGERRSVPYGDSWQCESCGRRWTTTQIPAEEYWGIMREMRRYRLVVVGVACLVAAVFIPLAILVSEALFLFVPVILGMWYVVFMPLWRRRVRARARSLPTWDLRAD